MEDTIYIGGAQTPTLRKVREAVLPVLAADGLKFVGAEMGREGSRSILWIYIDKDGGVTIDDCARVSPELSVALDVDDPISEAYEMRVSSPGIDRPLMTNEDFENHRDEQVVLQLSTPIEGRRKYSGSIVAVQDAQLKVACSDGEHSVPLSFIQKARIKPNYKIGQKKS